MQSTPAASSRGTLVAATSDLLGLTVTVRNRLGSYEHTGQVTSVSTNTWAGARIDGRWYYVRDRWEFHLPGELADELPVEPGAYLAASGSIWVRDADGTWCSGGIRYEPSVRSHRVIGTHGPFERLLTEAQWLDRADAPVAAPDPEAAPAARASLDLEQLLERLPLVEAPGPALTADAA